METNHTIEIDLETTIHNDSTLLDEDRAVRRKSTELPYESLGEERKASTKPEQMETSAPVEGEERRKYDQHECRMYIYMTASSTFITLSFTISTMSVYDILYPNYLYSFYSLVAIRLGILVYPFIIYYTNGKPHGKQMVVYMTVNIAVCLYMSLVVKVFDHNNLLLFVSILLMQNVGYSLNLTGLIRVREIIHFYNDNCIPYYFIALQSLIIVHTLIGLPLSYWEVPVDTTITVHLLISIVVYFFGMGYQRSISRTQHYIENSDSHNRATYTLSDYVYEFKKVSYYCIMIFINVATLGVVFPAMSNKIGPTFMKHRVWANCSTMVGYFFYVLGTFAKVEFINDDKAQLAITITNLFLSIGVSAVYTFRNKQYGGKDYMWMVSLLAIIFLNYTVGYYLRYSMKQVLKITVNRCSQTVVSSSMSTAYSVGTIISVIIAEMSKRL